MIFRTAAVFVLSIVLHASADPLPRVSPELVQSYAKACNHYVNRARFKQRGAQADFVVVLADACEIAHRELLDGDYAARRTAMTFLARLLELRDTVIDMNMTRVFGDSYTPYTRLKHGVGSKTEAVPRVSAAGEYLIAHRMGLLDAYRAWLDTHPSMTLASRVGQPSP